MEKHRWEVLVWGIVNAEEYLYRATNDKSLNCGTGGPEKAIVNTEASRFEFGLNCITFKINK